MSMTHIFFLTALTMSSSAVIFHGQHDYCLVVSTPMHSLYFQIFKLIALDMPEVCGMELINFL